MANYSRIQDICKSFGLDNDYAFIIFETYRDHGHKDSKLQWSILQSSLKDVGLSANSTAFNAYNQVMARVQKEQNNTKFAAYR